MPMIFGDFVIPPTLAQPSDLAAWTQQPAPDNAVVLLRSASAVILEATVAAYYDVDASTGLATDTQIKTAMQNATCAQAAAWAALGYDPLTGGVVTPSVASSKKIGTASIVYADGQDAASARTAAINGLVPEAVRILRANNLLIPNPWTFG